MKFHIVGNGETVEDISRGYDITVDELKNENKHIRIWNYLIPGTKLKIPVLTEALVEDINEIEPFIEDYYPKITLEEEQFTIENPSEEIIEEQINNQYILEENKNNNINDIEYPNNEIKDEITDEIIENKITSHSQDNVIRNNQPQILYRYVYPTTYYRPIVYVIPRR